MEKIVYRLLYLLAFFYVDIYPWRIYSERSLEHGRDTRHQRRTRGSSSRHQQCTPEPRFAGEQQAVLCCRHRRAEHHRHVRGL